MDYELNSYSPPPEFEENSSQQLVDLTLSDSTELFLIQWPIHQHPEIDGKVLTLRLGPDGKLGSFTDSTGKAYDIVSTSSKEPDATVILSSESESKFVGKISRRVSLVHYTSPEEYAKLSSDKKLMYQRSSGTLMTESSNPFVTPQSKGRKGSKSLARTISTHSSRQKSSFTGMNEQSKPPSKRKREESTGSMNQPTQGHETSPISGSSKHRNGHESSRTGSLDRDTTSVELSQKKR